MKIYEHLRATFFTEVLAGLFVLYFIGPIQKFIDYILFAFGSTLFRNYIDRLFEQSALLTPPDAGISSLLLIIIIIGMIFIGFTFLGFSDYLSDKNKSLAKSSQDQESSLNKFMFKNMRWFMLSTTILIFILLIPLLYSLQFQHRIISSFNQHITAISPFVDEQKMKLLKSNWTQMKSENDYKSIYKEIEIIAKRNNIRLPENLVFSFNSY